MRPSKWQRLGRVAVPVLAIVSLLLVHVQLRMRELHTAPAAMMVLYPHCYGTALSVLAGRKFQRLPVAKDAASEPVRAFLDLERDSISPVERFAAYFREAFPSRSSATSAITLNWTYLASSTSMRRRLSGGSSGSVGADSRHSISVSALWPACRYWLLPGSSLVDSAWVGWPGCCLPWRHTTD